MFDRLSSRLQSVVRNLRGFGTISEKNIQEALREVRLALLEADVHYATAKEFIERVKAKSLGAEVLAGVSPGMGSRGAARLKASAAGCFSLLLSCCPGVRPYRPA